MKKLLLLLLVVGCAEADLESGMAGEWQITWIMDEGSRTGSLILNDNHTGQINLEEDTHSPILPHAEQIEVEWVQTSDALTLTRQDNGFVLNYQFKSKTTNSIDLSFAGDINILLIRQ
ncbi:hypothetical protein [Fulvivirga lutimaris]|uniref:hypothetical protein n=1 Tax=Fulvivirga lutimaris TaxID=1819566 RepID=UPI0012BD3D35|nr:hypothetical protein [Fulvivirga lutimaris]MTI39670.1 hypothetical protein [Fulvivirga lutimaris]